MEGHARFLAHSPDLGNGQNGADLVVGVHGGHQAGILPDGVLHLLGGDVVVCPHIQVGHLEAFLLQLLQGVEHRVMLKGRGDDVLLSLPFPQPGGGENGLIVGLTAAGGENDLPGLTAQALRHGGPGSIQRFLGLLAHGVEGRRVAVNIPEIGHHGIHRGLAHPGGCRVVRVNLHRKTSNGYSPSNFVGNHTTIRLLCQ